MTYSIDNGRSEQITTGISFRDEAMRMARRIATERGESVYVYADGDPAEEVEPVTAESIIGPTHTDALRAAVWEAWAGVSVAAFQRVGGSALEYAREQVADSTAVEEIEMLDEDGRERLAVLVSEALDEYMADHPEAA